MDFICSRNVGMEAMAPAQRAVEVAFSRVWYGIVRQKIRVVAARR